MILSDTAFFYFFSAVFQGLAAIIGLVGVFAVFRLQQLGSSIDGVRNELYSDRGHSTHPTEVERFEKMTHAEKNAFIAQQEKQGMKTVLPLFRAWVAAESRMKALRGRFWGPIGLLAITMLANAWALPFSVAISKWSLVAKALTVVVNLGLVTASVVWTLSATRALVEEAMS